MTDPSQATSTASISKLFSSIDTGSDVPPPSHSVFDRSIADRLDPARVAGRAQSRSDTRVLAFDMDPDSTLTIYNDTSAPQMALVGSSEQLSGLALRPAKNPRVMRISEADPPEEDESMGIVLLKLFGCIVILALGEYVDKKWARGK